MKVYQNLQVTGEAAEIELVLTRIQATKASAWKVVGPSNTRNQASTLVLQRPIPGSDRLVRLHLHVFNASEGLQRLDVSNIVPVSSGALSEDQYGLLLQSFRDDVLITACEGRSVRISMDPPDVTPETFIGTELFDALQAYSTSANKTIPHPLDLRRWNTFVIGCHRKNVTLPTDVLADWMEHDGWSTEQAVEHSIKYENGRSLLADFDRANN